MSRTVARLTGDTPFTDMMIALSPPGDIISFAGAVTATRVAFGQYVWRTTAATTAYTMVGAVSGVIFRTGVQDDYQQAFGSTRAGGANNLPFAWPQTNATGNIVLGTFVSIPVLNSVNFVVGQGVIIDTVASGVQEFAIITSIPDGTHIVVNKIANSHTAPYPVNGNPFTTPGPRQGRPPFAGFSQLSPQINPPSKGINILQIAIIYNVVTTAITVPTAGLAVTSFSNVTAPVTTTLIPNATNGLATAVGGQPYVIPIPVPVANQGFLVTPNSVVSVEFDFTTGATGNVDIYGFIITGQYNYD